MLGNICVVLVTVELLLLLLVVLFCFIINEFLSLLCGCVGASSKFKTGDTQASKLIIKDYEINKSIKWNKFS